MAAEDRPPRRMIRRVGGQKQPFGPLSKIAARLAGSGLRSNRVTHMKLNGWARTWIVLTAIWVILLATEAPYASPMTYVAPPAILLTLGAAVAWIRRGLWPKSQNS